MGSGAEDSIGSVLTEVERVPERGERPGNGIYVPYVPYVPYGPYGLCVPSQYVTLSVTGDLVGVTL